MFTIWYSLHIKIHVLLNVLHVHVSAFPISGKLSMYHLVFYLKIVQNCIYLKIMYLLKYLGIYLNIR